MSQAPFLMPKEMKKMEKKAPNKKKNWVPKVQQTQRSPLALTPMSPMQAVITEAGKQAVVAAPRLKREAAQTKPLKWTNMARLITSISLPGIAEAVRGPPSMSNMPTTIVNPYVEYTVSFASSASTDPDANQHFVAISKNPLLGVIWSHSLVVPFKYDYQFRSILTVGAPPRIENYSRINLACVGSNTTSVTTVHSVDPIYGNYNPITGNSVDVGGPTCYCLKSFGKSFFMTHCESSTLNLRFFASTGSGPGASVFPLSAGWAIQARIYYITGENNETVYWEGAINDNLSALSLALLGFWRVELMITTPANNTFSSIDMTMFINNAALTPDQTQLYSRPHLGFNAAGPGWDFANARINSAAITVSNVTPVITRGGTIAGVALPTRSSFFSFLAGDNYYTQLTRLPRVTTLGLETGMYGFHKPTPLPDAELAPLVARDTNTLAATGFDGPLFPPGGWIVCAYDRVVSEPLELVYRITYAAEGVPYTNFYQVEPSMTSSVQWMALCDAMANSTQFTENPLHIKSLLQAAKKAATGIVKNGPEVLKLLSNVFPGLKIPAMLAEGAAFMSRHV